MARYLATRGNFDTAATCELIDTEAGIRAVIVPSVGSNMIALRHDKLGAKVLHEPGSLEELMNASTAFGYPVLMPPNRIWKARFELDGVVYEFPVNREDYHIHGLVHNIEWKVVTHTASEDEGAVLVTEMDSAEHPSVQRTYPQHFKLSMKFVLKDGTVTVETRCENFSDTALPFGVGFHPYFNTPMTEQSSKDLCFARLAAQEHWELERCFPTGQRHEPSGDFDFREFKPVSSLALDDLYGRVLDRSAVLEDRGSGLRLTVTASESYPFWVVWTGASPSAPFICFEPYSCVTNAPNLDMPISETGLKLLEKGETFTGTVTLSLSRIQS